MVDIVYIDGQKFTPEMAYWFNLMARDFLKDTGCSLHASSGLRFGWEQEAIFRERYVPANQVNGRRVYDYRWWNGVQWARISAAGTVATPGTSNHEFEATGIGAVDVYDSGNDAGVTSHGSFRANWFHANSWKYFFDSEGDNFGEEWHKRFLGNLYASRPDWAGGGAIPLPIPTPTPTKRKRRNMSTGVIHTEGGADQTRSGAIVDFEAGTFSPFGWFPVSYANGVAKGFGLEASAPVTRGHFDQIRKDVALAAARRGQIFVDIDDADVPQINPGEVTPPKA